MGIIVKASISQVFNKQMISFVSITREKVLNLKGAFQRTFNRPLSRLLLLQFHAKTIVRLTLARRLLLHETAVPTTY